MMLDCEGCPISEIDIPECDDHCRRIEQWLIIHDKKLTDKVKSETILESANRNNYVKLAMDQGRKNALNELLARNWWSSNQRLLLTEWRDEL